MPEKKNDKVVKPADKKLGGILEQHPSVQNSARGLFHNQNGTTVIQERVPRGDLPQEDVIMPRNEFDLTSEDLEKIAAEAKKAMDPLLVKYDEDVAMEDALARVVWSTGDGKYQGRLSANTQTLVLDLMRKGKKDKKGEAEKKASEETDAVVEAASIDSLLDAIPTSFKDIEDGGDKKKKTETPEEAGMDKKALQKMAAELSEKLAAVNVLLGEGGEAQVEDKEAAASNDATKKFEVGRAGAHEFEPYDKVTGADAAVEAYRRMVSGSDPVSSPEQIQIVEVGPKREVRFDLMGKVEIKKEASVEDPVIASLDEIAGLVEKEAHEKDDFDLFRIAYQIDAVSDYLAGAKDASALQTDPDDKFIREAFKAGVKQRDSDEKFMDEFKTDNSMESRRVVGKISVMDKKASALPYAVKKDA